MKNNKGITLIALVITIIVLLILAGVAIAMLSGDNSILKNSKAAEKANAIASAKEIIGVKASEAVTDFYHDAYYAGNATVTNNGVAYAVAKALGDPYNPNVNGITYTAPSEPATSTNGSQTADITFTIKYNADGEVTTGTINKVTGAITWKITTEATNKQ